ncbi:MAG: adenylyltransferase/cytidyltransferase family protein, partial [Candidatus Margulisbacteria bacterium]|nr:adenylyltransferase/cytidyltransferase family protein [Candidatus Margulisiibacteriota bacterium]
MTAYLLFGGTFNPFHLGHLAVIHAARDVFPHAQCVLIPNFQPPHKDKLSIAPKHRHQMLHIVCKQYGFQLSDIETNRKGVSWTIDTVQEWRKNNPTSPLKLVIGSDSFLS